MLHLCVLWISWDSDSGRKMFVTPPLDFNNLFGVVMKHTHLPSSNRSLSLLCSFKMEIRNSCQRTWVEWVVYMSSSCGTAWTSNAMTRPTWKEIVSIPLSPVYLIPQSTLSNINSMATGINWLIDWFCSLVCCRSLGLRIVPDVYT